MSDDEGNTVARQPGFSQRVSELQDLAEIAAKIKVLAQDVEVRMLGHSGPHGDNKKEQVYDTSGPLSLISGMRNYTRHTQESLQGISNSLQRITEELGGVGLNEPNKDENAGNPEFLRR